jgi:hypothetical protein
VSVRDAPLMTKTKPLQESALINVEHFKITLDSSIDLQLRFSGQRKRCCRVLKSSYRVAHDMIFEKKKKSPLVQKFCAWSLLSKPTIVAVWTKKTVVKIFEKIADGQCHGV